MLVIIKNYLVIKNLYKGVAILSLDLAKVILTLESDKKYEAITELKGEIAKNELNNSVQKQNQSRKNNYNRGGYYLW